MTEQTAKTPDLLDWIAWRNTMRSLVRLCREIKYGPTDCQAAAEQIREWENQ
ncbi:hypothetical protein LCGC14_0248820 [marine sediment metagenome]|uniref:Uncharacterized protein n=1 Tax=marine sediment metagenome TaxID=412755 RepID=A0A0F9U530_9ZZZZ